ncbi:ATP-binding cassette domain-containing protein [Herbaspirillum rubrisubalbicans]|jgi:taurine transport system ATP-binding protein|uniref:taurine ABC transporter ATP-binding protein n=1 Tax=Herbaspirillum rubrisubalbicans TaxID=80842 RepID=UPI001558FFEB|nr:ATP-binding cassette domain-containing protein [Herbaspirillum rubrisubalbicans]MCP1573246.1 taurine transport system ATP-binding protein [Herbaspirillum rubrisubalbicans]NQE47562.1 taurine transporter ATP-binding subunit [Herbaspirillum rubrisubalbicans]
MLEIDQVSIEYPARKGPPSLALDQVSLAIAAGEFVVALGASGCGKTTLLNTIAGFIAPTRGEIRLGGETVEGPGSDRGVVFQKHALMPWMNVVENVEFGLKLRKMPLHERRRIALECLNKVGLLSSAYKQVYELSGGMQQRVGVARAIASSPAVMLLDEPLGALDAFTREAIQELLLDLWHESQGVFFFITHDVEEALFLATRLLIMAPSPGRVVHDLPMPFAQRYLATRDARGTKADPEFIAAREHVLALVHQTSSSGMH